MIYELLNKGEEYARSSSELCRETGLTTRQLTAAITQERRAGKPICASCSSNVKGYYIAPDKATMQAYCGRLLHRLREIAKTRSSCLACMDELPEAADDE